MTAPFSDAASANIGGAGNFFRRGPELAALKPCAVRVLSLLLLLPMSLVPADNPQFLTAITQRVRAVQYQALQLVNHEQLQLYWDLSRLIADRQGHAG